MTNYSGRIDEIINSAYEGEVSWIHDQLDGTSVMDEAIERIEDEKAKTKQAIQELIDKKVKEDLSERQKSIKDSIDMMIDLIFDADADEFTGGTKQRYDNTLKEIEAIHQQEIAEAGL